jgi:hypothetical protein
MLPPGLHSQYSSQRGVNVKLMKLHYLKTFLFTSVLCASLTSYALDPRVNYDKISSENFDIIYDAKSYELAKLYLQEAERAHKILVEIFGISPAKTVVVLDDSYDIANGSAIGVPRPLVNAYVNPPTPLSTIDHFSYWPRDLFVHEYTHILNMEPTKGIWKPFRFVFGSLFRPNMLLPRWYLEGLAVEMESRFNQFGRLKSTDYDAMIRAFYLDSKWGEDNLSAINESSTPSWPGGQRPYFYGALVWHELVQSKSLSIIKTFNERYARRFPWFITRPMVDELGMTYQDFLKNVYTKYGSLAQKQIQKISEQEITKGTPILTKDSVFDHSPQMSPDGDKLLFVSQNLDGDSKIYVMKRLGDTWVPLTSVNPKEADLHLDDIAKDDIQRASWFPNSNKIVFDSNEKFDRANHFYDLFTFDFDKKEIEPLTKGLRAREPAVSPKGDQIIYVSAASGKTSLYTVDSAGKNPTLIYSPTGYDRVSRPDFLSDDEIIFSEKTSGIDKLHVVNLKTKKTVRVLDFPAKYPIVTSKGILFSSNKSGVENLYIVSSDFTSIKPLTNSLTRVINGTLDIKNNKIIYSELTGTGPQIKEATVPQNIKLLPPVTHMIAGDFTEKISEEVPTVNAEPKRYHALPYMFPQFWMPSVLLAQDGTIIDVMIPGSDPTGFHNYTLSGTYDTRPDKFSGYFFYDWKNSLGTTSFLVSDYNQWYSSLKDSTNSQKLLVKHQVYIPNLSNSWKAIFGYEYKKSSIVENIGFGPETRNHYFSGPSVAMTFDNMEQKNMAISPSGEKAKAELTKYLSNTNHSEYTETFLKFSHFQKEWLPERHVLAFTAQTSITNSHRNLLLGTTSSESEFTVGPSGDGFVTRGYPAGEFIGYTIASGSLEYRFPLFEKWKGPDNPTAYFLKRIHGSVFAETLTLKGAYFNELNQPKRANLGKYYSSGGVELKFDTTIAYHVPITWKVVGGYGFDTKANGGLNVYLVMEAPQAF